MEKSKKNKLIKRIMSTLVLAPLTLWMLYYGWTTTSFLVLIVSALLAWEWSEMVPNKKKTVYAVSYLSTSVMPMMFLYPSYVCYPLVFILLMTIFVWFKAKGEEHRCLLTLGIPYIALGTGALAWLYTWISPIAAIWLLVAVWGVDIGGYLIGSTIKGPKLAPKISPNKTWSGLLGAIIFSALVSWGFSYYISVNIKTIDLVDPVWSILGASTGTKWFFWTIVIGAALAIVAQCGDLLESKVKRYLQVKDSSNLIPGHGGMFDRVDGLLFSAPFVLVLCVVLVYYMAR